MISSGQRCGIAPVAVTDKPRCVGKSGALPVDAGFMNTESRVVGRKFEQLARRACEFCLVLLVPFVGVQLAMSAGGTLPEADRPLVMAGTSSAVGPIADWLEDLIDDLEDATDDLEDAEAAVAMRQGPLDAPGRAVVADALDHVLFTIDRILDPRQYPNMDPPDAGYIDVDSDVTSLQDYALECLILAEDALHEAVSPRVDCEAIGTRLRTIEYLITRAGPHNYRTRAGVAVGPGALPGSR